MSKSDWRWMEVIQLMQLRAYKHGRSYQASITPIGNIVQNRIRLPICESHQIDPLRAICKNCGMIVEELLVNE